MPRFFIMGYEQKFWNRSNLVATEILFITEKFLPLPFPNWNKCVVINISSLNEFNEEIYIYIFIQVSNARATGWNEWKPSTVLNIEWYYSHRQGTHIACSIYIVYTILCRTLSKINLSANEYILV